MISVRGITKRFGTHQALDGVELEVPEGTVQGLLGPNGAGKTTTVRVLTTLLQPDSGDAFVAGRSVLTEGHAVRQRLGVSGQYAAVDEKLTGFENLTMVGELYGMRRKDAKARARELLREFRLDDVPDDKRAGTYSGGCAAGSTWPGRSSPGPRSSSSTNRPPGWTPRSSRHLGRDRVAGIRWDHRAPHHPVPRGSRPAR